MCGVLNIRASSTNNDSLRFEVLLTSRLLSDVQKDALFNSSLDITSDRLILLSTNDQFYLLGWGGISPVGKKVEGKINSFRYTSDSLLMIIRNRDLCAFDLNGKLSKLFELPNEGMEISRGKYVMYAYDRNIDGQKNALYLIARRGKYSKLFEIPSSINSVVEWNNTLLFASGNAIFSYDIKTKDLKAIASLPKGEVIRSIHANSSSDIVYFSTDKMVFATKDSSVVLVTNQFGGVVRFYNGGLIVFNPEKKYLIRILGVENKITSQLKGSKTPQAKEQPSDILTNAMVIDMVKLKLSDSRIINIINKSVVNFNLGVDDMIFLSGQNVSSEVIMAMKNAMRKKTSNVPNNTKQ
jgi:hypothetical protein